ncbi:hypothetical protein C7M61_005188 [Candidozyma pseudohaemuli]|uniref:Uncharacterized protein n=1 Tax=Candidozyma pseudohaemuli TaxID=418784 RepID=A0A2P7YCN5_9ASCO|nr:hypothetical protein C7M61_005188 [[Candida] pseudohaemulonii]PSK33724.1 hypothetical protein C7M61_005188 [[Candida] pseudohaemulonii]
MVLVVGVIEVMILVVEAIDCTLVVRLSICISLRIVYPGEEGDVQETLSSLKLPELYAYLVEEVNLQEPLGPKDSELIGPKQLAFMMFQQFNRLNYQARKMLLKIPQLHQETGQFW